MYELIYTSVPKGLIPGRSGFATAAMSEGMPPNLIVPLENLSGYNFTLRNGEFMPELNPPCCYYIKMRYGNQLLHVAGRVAPNGLDYSKRNNKIAHHLLFESVEELEDLAGGVAGLFFKSGVFRSEYSEEPAMLPFRKVPRCTQTAPLPAKNWAKLTGHAGFAAYTAERFSKNPDKPLYLIYPAWVKTEELLQLAMEATALLHNNIRKYFTFSTYFGSCAASVDCFLRMVPDFSPLVSNLRRFHQNDIIELGQDNAMPTESSFSDIYEYACTGRRPEIASSPKSLETLDQAAINIFADSTRQQPQPDKMLTINTPAITVPPPVSWRKFVFAGAAAIMIAAILSLLLYDIPGKTQVSNYKPTGKKRSEHTVKKISQPALPPQPAPAAEPQISPAKVKLPPTEKVQAKPAAAAVKPPLQITGDLFSNKKLRSAAVNMPLEPAMDLFIEFHRKTAAADNNAVTVALPEILHGCNEFYPVMERIGTSGVESSKFVSRGPVAGEVYVRAAEIGSLPLKPLAGEIMDIPHLMIKLSADKKSLQLIKYTGDQSRCIMPQAGYIKQIYFRKQGKVFLWHNKFSRKYITAIKPGKLVIRLQSQGQKSDTLAYTPTEREKMLSDIIITKFGKCSAATFLASPFHLQDWNDSVKEYKQYAEEQKMIRNTINQIIQQKSIQKTSPVRSRDEISTHLKDLNKLAQDGDTETFNARYQDFLNSFFNPDEKNLITADELQKETQKLYSMLKNHTLDPGKHKELKKYNKTWVQIVEQLKNLHSLQKRLADCNKKFETAQNRLKISAERIKNKAAQVHADIKKSLLEMMTEKKQSTWQLHPDTVTADEVKKLCNDITSKITFEPVINADGE